MDLLNMQNEGMVLHTSTVNAEMSQIALGMGVSFDDLATSEVDQRARSTVVPQNKNLAHFSNNITR